MHAAGLDPRFSRRAFLRQLGGIGLLITGCRPQGKPVVTALRQDHLGKASALEPGTPANLFLREAGKSFRGARIRVLTEDTPPSSACRGLAASEFTALTGIEIEWVQLPLADVYARTQVDLQQGSGHHDVLYLDQSWLAQFSGQVETLDEWQAREDLSYPGWDFADFLPPLRTYLSSYKGRRIAIPYDITLFIQMCRRDLFEKAGIAFPRSLPAYMESSWVIDRMFSPKMRGTVAQLRVGHYSLLCHWSSWLWAHGGSFFNADGSPDLDSAASLEALNYLLQLKQQMPPQVIGWDWHMESVSFARGDVGFYSSWAEFFPSFDDPAHSRIVGLAEPMAMPEPLSLKRVESCGFGECPGIAHQGGSGIALSRNSRQKEASWLFMQWATSPDITVRSSLLGGGASATRYSTFEDPRILQNQQIIGPGTTRHFPAMKEAILRQMGTEPHHPRWPDLALRSLPVELGKFITGQQNARTTANAMQSLTAKIIRK